MDDRARTQFLFIRKRYGVWKIGLVVKVAGKWFLYASGGCRTWDIVPAAAAEVWALRPNHGER